MWSFKAKIAWERSPTLGSNGQDVVPPPCSAIGWGLPEGTDLSSKAQADSEDTNSFGLAANHIPWCWVAKSVLDRGLSAATLCLPERSLKFPSRGWLTTDQESWAEDPCIRWDFKSGDPNGLSQLLGPVTGLQPALIQTTQLFHFSHSFHLAQAPASLLTLANVCPALS